MNILAKNYQLIESNNSIINQIYFYSYNIIDN